MNEIQEIQARLERMPADERARLIKAAETAAGHMGWLPNAGPQTQAYFSLADYLLYGGQAAGGKTDLLLGLATEEHLMSLIMRREYVALGGVLERCKEIVGAENVREAPPPRAVTPDGKRVINFGAAQQPGDEQRFMGRARDLLGIDEATQFLRSQVVLLRGWVRTAVEGQRARSVMATNPPLNANGDWIIGDFRPWLDLTHDNPAKPGELRWFITDDDGADVEVPDSTPIEREGNIFIPQSRTFIPAALKDNPYLVKTGYQATLDALPEPLRSAVRDGNFMAVRADAEFQVIPSDWIRAAQARWTPDPPKDVPMCAIGVDPTGGGKDECTLAPRYGGWYAELVAKPGKDVPKGSDIAALVVKHRKHGAKVIMDMGGGYGTAPREHLEGNGVDVKKFNGANKSQKKSGDNVFKLRNKRSEAWWRFREALDPGQEGGSQIALPKNDQALAADLAAPTFTVDASGLKIESKDDIRKRLGRSTDRGDAVVMAWTDGDKPATPTEAFQQFAPRRKKTPKVKLGRTMQKRRRR